MHSESSSTDDLWCPLDERATGRPFNAMLDMTPADWAALSRFSSGDWVSDASIGRLESLGLVERVFGQALLTRTGRSTIGLDK